MDPAPTGRAGERSRWIAAGSSGVFAFLLTVSWRRWSDLIIDFGEELYIPWQMVEGRLLYTDLFYVRGPFSAYLNYLVFAVAGVGYLQVALVNAAIAGGITVALYRLFGRGSGPFGAAAAALSFLVVFAFGHYTTTGNYNFVTPYSHEQTHAVALALGSLLLLCKYLDSGRSRWCFWIGLTLGASFLTKPELFLCHAASVLSALLPAWIFGGTAAGRARVARDRSFWSLAKGIQLSRFFGTVLYCTVLAGVVN